MKLIKIKRGDWKTTVVWDYPNPRIGAGHRTNDDPQNPQCIPLDAKGNLWLELTREEIATIAKLERILLEQDQWQEEHLK